MHKNNIPLNIYLQNKVLETTSGLSDDSNIDI